MIILMGTFSALPGMLKENSLEYQAMDPGAIHSLTALILDRKDITFLVIQLASLPWSDGHILAAAKMLQPKGGLILLGQAAKHLANSPLAAWVETEAQAAERLRKPKAPPVKKSGNTGGKALVPEIKPLRIPPAKILMVDVIGAQPRIGCTTQAIALWQYFHLLGIDAAIVMPETQIRQISETMQVEKTLTGGCVVDGIPFVTDFRRANDCFIRDLGCSQSQDADVTVLVAGVKPWELANTARALRALHGKVGMVVLSFASVEAAAKLRPLFGGQNIPVAVSPYIPDPWQAAARALQIYDMLLRPLLEQRMKEDEACIGNERQEIL